MAPGNYLDTTPLYQPNSIFVSTAVFDKLTHAYWSTSQRLVSYVSAAVPPLWADLRERDRLMLARVRRIVESKPAPLPCWALPTVRAYTLRINAAGRPGRRRRHSVKLAT